MEDPLAQVVMWIAIAVIAVGTTGISIWYKLKKDEMEHERRMKELEIEKMKLQQSQSKQGSPVNIP